jgi:hypothetical protein
VEPVQALPHVLQVEVSVDLGGDLRVGVPEDPLDSRERDAGLEEERRRRVAEVVEPQPLLVRDRPEAHAAPRAPARLGMGVPLGVTAPLPAAPVLPAVDYACTCQRTAENVLRERFAVRAAASSL